MKSFFIIWMKIKLQPDHDGDNYKGFRLENDFWGQIDGCEAFLSIEPIWAMYGK